MSLEKQSQQRTEGRFLAVDVRSAGSWTWLGPAWAVLCGAVASGGLAIDWGTVVLLLLAVLLADPVLGSVWGLVTGGHLASPQPAKINPRSPQTAPALPYTQPGSVASRFLEYLNGKLMVWRSVIWPQAGASILAFGCLGAFALLLAAVLGALPFIFAVVALGVAVGRVRLASKRDAVSRQLASLYLAALPWLIGYVAFGEIDITAGGFRPFAQPLVWAAAYGMVFHAYSLIGGQRLSRGAALLVIAQVAAVAALILVKQPILAGTVALLLVPQMMLQPALLSVGDGVWYLQRIRVFTLLATLATATAMVA